jgi:lipopolysaccharide export system protein LptA
VRVILILLLVGMAVFGAQVVVTSESFIADEKQLITKFIGNVTVIKGNDNLRADEVLVNLDQKRQPLKYTATGGVKVKMQINEKYYNASGNTLTYEPNEQRYILNGRAFLEEIDNEKKVYGERIEVDQRSGIYKVDGSGEPARFIFQVEDNK